jgi:hypothetical protein
MSRVQAPLGTPTYLFAFPHFTCGCFDFRLSYFLYTGGLLAGRITAGFFFASAVWGTSIATNRTNNSSEMVFTNKESAELPPKFSCLVAA